MNRRDFIKTTALSGGVLISPDLLEKMDRNLCTSDKRIKIGQIGVTHEHAGARMESLKKLEDVYEIVGVVDDRQSTAARYAGDNLKPFEGLKWMKEEELFKTPGLQAVMIETANADLVPTAMRCMERNLAIAMDKPGGEDLRLFRKLMEGCKKETYPSRSPTCSAGTRLCCFARKQYVKAGWAISSRYKPA